MRGDFRYDFVILSLVISAIVHGILIYSARPLIVSHYSQDLVGDAARGPMRVRPLPELADPVTIDRLLDTKPERAAPLPDAEDENGTMRVPDATTDINQELAKALQSVSVPKFEDLRLPNPQPEVAKMPDCSALSEDEILTRPEKMITDVAAPKGSESFDGTVVYLPRPNENMEMLGDLPSLPLDIMRVPTPPTPVTSEKDGAWTAFTPYAEVMDAVDEELIEQEKAAVRALVNVPTAADLARVVDLRLARTEVVDGAIYFRVTVTPKEGLKAVPKDVVVLIDASGSVGSERMGSIRRAAKKILRSAANTGDRFNLVAFRDRYSYAFRAWQDCSVSSFAAADRWLDDVASYGRTDVFATIASVLTLPRDPTRPLIALVVTDGEANAGVADTSQILARFSALNDGLISVYMYGIKSSANRRLIDMLTRNNRGESFIFDGARWRAGEGIEKLSNRFRDPLIADLRLVFASRCPAVAYPRLLKNLYRGQSVEIVGCVPSGVKEIAFSLSGLHGSRAYEGFFSLPLSSAVIDPDLSQTVLEHKTQTF